MLHHVALEVGPDSVAGEISFWLAAGFVEVPAPEALGEGYTWLERGGIQIHLMHKADPAVPDRGHVAIVAADLDAVVARLRTGGFEVRAARELWGEKRAKALTPAGHTVELMAAPPPDSIG
jgi:hypothetical protein